MTEKITIVKAEKTNDKINKAMNILNQALDFGIRYNVASLSTFPKLTLQEVIKILKGVEIDGEQKYYTNSWILTGKAEPTYSKIRKNDLDHCLRDYFLYTMRAKAREGFIMGYVVQHWKDKDLEKVKVKIEKFWETINLVIK